MKHFLETLGVAEDATWQQIREGYRDQMKIWHPDRFAGDQRLMEKAEEQTKEILYAVRRLKELRKDIEQIGTGFDESEPFLQQYAAKVGEGVGQHGLPTREDRRRGYNQDSFANWKAMRKTIVDTVSESAARLTRVVQEARPRRRSVVVKTTRVRRGNNILTFVLCSGILVVVACIGALNLPKIMRPPPPADTETLPANNNTQPKNAERQSPDKKEKSGKATLLLSKQQSLSSNDKPAIVAAAMQCNAKEVSKRIRQGEDMNAADAGGQTALIWAARQNCPSVIRVLMSRGADHRRTSNNGFTAYRWAEWTKNDDARRTLARFGVRK